jgi:high-affinity iron transporter
MAFFAVMREGLESALFLLAAFQQGGAAAGVGAVLGLVVAVGLGLGFYFGSVRLDLRRFFTWTGGVIILFAAGLFAQSVRSLHEAGIWNSLQSNAWDMSSIISNGSTGGNVLRGLIGYQAVPTVGEAIAYWAYLIPVAFLFFVGPHLRTPPANPTEATEPSVGTSAVNA